MVVTHEVYLILLLCISQCLGVLVGVINHFWKTKFYHLGSVENFSNAIFFLFCKSEKKCQNFHFLTPLTPFFEKTKKFDLKKIFFGGMWHMFSIQFLKPFSILEVFFQKFCFLTPLTPFLEKLKMLTFL